MVFAMVVLGGLTRLTGSGLSIVEWRPLSGILPPLDDAGWRATFESYRTSPEFQKINFWMTLADFKAIYWLEYVHRLWGRLIGVAFLLPFLWFLWRRHLPRRLIPRLGLLFVLGGAQGALGWYMVASGLVERPEVSHYRLAAHLALAALIYGVLLWTALGLLLPRPSAQAASGPRLLAAIAVGWIGLVIVTGALVAGLDGGLAYNTFPLMGGRFLPEAMLAPPPGVALLDNPAAVQFVHRVAAAVTVVLAIAVYLWCRQCANRRAAIAAGALLAMTVAQAGLGIATLLTQVAIPLAAAHQAGALLALSLALWTAYELPRPSPARARRRSRLLTFMRAPARRRSRLLTFMRARARRRADTSAAATKPAVHSISP